MFSALPAPADTDAVLADGTALLPAGTAGRHPLRRRTDCRDVVDVEALAIGHHRVQGAVAAYGKVFDLSRPSYRSGLLIDVRV